MSGIASGIFRNWETVESLSDKSKENNIIYKITQKLLQYNISSIRTNPKYRL